MCNHCDINYCVRNLNNINFIYTLTIEVSRDTYEYENGSQHKEYSSKCCHDDIEPQHAYINHKKKYISPTMVLIITLTTYFAFLF